MRTTVIPAQMTTVEDKIAGDLNLTQILLLIFPVFWTSAVYALFLPVMRFAWYKLPAIGIVTILSLTLALRIKGKVLVEWLGIIIRYNLRPGYWVYNKNETEGRRVDSPPIRYQPVFPVAKAQGADCAKRAHPVFTIRDLIRLDHYVKSKHLTVRYRTSHKGGLHVAFDQITK